MAEYPTVHDNDVTLLKKITINTGQIADGSGGGGGGSQADTIIYNNITSGLTAEDVQAAIDEVVVALEDRIESVEDSVTDGQVIVFNGASGKSGKKATGTGIAELTNGVLGVATAGTDYVAPGAVTSSGLTMATARLLGRTTASSGSPEEITVGTGLSLSGGSLSATGSSGSKTLCQWTALDNQPPAANFATIDTRNSIAVLDFDAGTAESAVFVGIVPEAASFSTGLKVILKWMATSATSGDVIWTAAIERSNTDLDSDGFATGVDFAASTANGTSGIITTASLDLNGTTEIDSMVAGDLFRLKITRKAADGSDTMTGDAELVAVETQQR